MEEKREKMEEKREKRREKARGKENGTWQQRMAFQLGMKLPKVTDET